MGCGISVPYFGEYYQPNVLANLAQETEEAGWDGFFLRRPGVPDRARLPRPTSRSLAGLTHNPGERSSRQRHDCNPQ